MFWYEYARTFPRAREFLKRDHVRRYLCAFGCNTVETGWMVASSGKFRRNLPGICHAAARARPHAHDIHRRLGDTVEADRVLDVAVAEGHCAEGREIERGRDQAERLAQVPGLCEDG